MQQIIHKDGSYYIYDQLSNSFLLENVSRVDIIQFYVDEVIKKTEAVLDVKSPYGYFTISYEDAVNMIKNGAPKVEFC